MRQAAGIPFGRFVLKKRLARGGMAEVFLAHQRGPEGFDRRVAVKRILPHLVETDEFVGMFHDEARLAARLTHPNIVHIYEYGRVDEHYFIAMEYVAGVHAGAIIKRGTEDRMPFALVARIGADACAGLRYAHQLRDDSGRRLEVVHRDISPPNLMITYDGVVKLVDFGIAKAVSQVEQTRPGVVKGKYAYMSPEQTTNKPLDGRSDVFSLGLVLWELLAGRVALNRTDPVEAMRAIRDGRIPSLKEARPDVPAALEVAIAAALTRDRDERPTASDLGVMLEGYIKSSPELATSMQLADWVAARFPPPNLTGEVPAMRGAPGATRMTAPATQATAHATVATPDSAQPPATVATGPATSATAHEPVQRAQPPRTARTEALEAPTTQVDLDAELTAIVPTGSRAWPTGSFGAAPSGRGRRIAIAAGVTALVGAIVFAILLSTGGDAASEPAAAPPPPDAEVAVVEMDPDPLPLPDAAPAIDAPPELAALEVITTPPGALVTIGDDRPSMTSPAMFADLPPGTVTIEIELDGYEAIERPLDLAAGERRTLELALAELPPPEPVVKRRPKRSGKGKLTVRTNPYSVVYLGRKKLGVTPFANISLPAGTHTLTFKNPDKKTHKRRVKIRRGKTTKLNFKLP